MNNVLSKKFCEEFNKIMGQAVALAAILINPDNPNVEELLAYTKKQYKITDDYATVEHAIEVMLLVLKILVIRLEEKE